MLVAVVLVGLCVLVAFVVALFMFVGFGFLALVAQQDQFEMGVGRFRERLGRIFLCDGGG